VATEGLAALTMSRLAEELETVPSAVYRYFPSKGALITAVQCDAIERLTRQQIPAENRRPEVTKLLHQITALDEVRCGQIAHDTSGAALFVILRAFGCKAYDGLKVLIHATSHDQDRSRSLSTFSQMFESVSLDAMAYLMSAWRGEVNLLDMSKPEYQPFAETRRIAAAANTSNSAIVDQTLDALSRIGIKRAS